MAVWAELKVVLAGLQDQQPGASEDRYPPLTIHLAAWAAATAEDLHRQFGNSVDLTVGAQAARPVAAPACPLVVRAAPPDASRPTGQRAQMSSTIRTRRSWRRRRAISGRARLPGYTSGQA
jgi:hypothetical protein